MIAFSFWHSFPLWISRSFSFIPTVRLLSHTHTHTHSDTPQPRLFSCVKCVRAADTCYVKLNDGGSLKNNYFFVRDFNLTTVELGESERERETGETGESKLNSLVKNPVFPLLGKLDISVCGCKRHFLCEWFTHPEPPPSKPTNSMGIHFIFCNIWL